MAKGHTMSYAFNRKALERAGRIADRGNMSMAAELKNLVWAWKEKVRGTGIMDILSENEQLIWERGQGSWKPASVAHQARKAKRGDNPLTMVQSQRLYDAATLPRSPDNIAYGDARNFYYGVNAENFRGFGGWSYPEIHQFRGDSTGTTRPFMYITEEARAALNSWFGRVMRFRLFQLYGHYSNRSRKGPR